MAKTKNGISGFLRNLYRVFKTRDAYPLLILILPIIYLMIIDPVSFTLVWFVGQQVGRGALVFVFFLVAWDFNDSRKFFSATHDKKRYVVLGALLIALLIYYYFRVFNGFFARPPIDPSTGTPMDTAFTTYVRVYVTSQLGVSQESTLSFLLAMDFVFYALFCLAATALLYSVRSVRLMTLPVIYLIGLGILDMMDAYFPEDSLAFLQVWVYLIWNVVVFLLSLMGFHTNVDYSAAPIHLPSLILHGNQLFLWGYKGYVGLAIYWPSSGVVSMIIYSLVIVVLMVKLDAPRSRKAVYAVVGAVGTYFVNVIRITLIVLYITYVSSDFQAFHASIGEVLFIAWIFIYLLAVIHYENQHQPRQPPPTTTKRSKPRPAADSTPLRDRASSKSQSVKKARGEQVKMKS
jgi:thaumarchaeosortase